MPVDLTVSFADGSTKKIHQSIAVWEKGNRTVTVKFTGAKKISKIELGSIHSPDINKKNNVWKSK